MAAQRASLSLFYCFAMSWHVLPDLLWSHPRCPSPGPADLCRLQPSLELQPCRVRPQLCWDEGWEHPRGTNCPTLLPDCSKGCPSCLLVLVGLWGHCVLSRTGWPRGPASAAVSRGGRTCRVCRDHPGRVYLRHQVSRGSGPSLRGLGHEKGPCLAMQECRPG